MTANLSHSEHIRGADRNPAHLSARIANLLEIIETVLETGAPNERRNQAALGLVRATMEDADELADLLAHGC